MCTEHRCPESDRTNLIVTFFYVHAGDQDAGPERFEYRENRRSDDRSSAATHRVQSEATFGRNYSGTINFNREFYN